MLQLKRILCPVNISPESEQALRYAVALARAFQAELIVCHCLASAEKTEVDKTETALRNAVIEHVCLASPDTIRWKPLLVQGDAATEIPRVATEHQADLMVLRSLHRPHIAALFGSTIEAVCHAAPCPVLITHPGEREWAGLTSNDVGLERILWATDFSGEAEVAAAYALALAQNSKPNCMPCMLLAPPAVDAEVERAASLLHRAIPTETYCWSQVKQVVRAGRPYQEILRYAEEQEMDLICMGAHSTGLGKLALFGSNVDRVLRQARCPVLIARALKPAFVAAEEKTVESWLEAPVVSVSPASADAA